MHLLIDASHWVLSLRNGGGVNIPLHASRGFGQVGSDQITGCAQLPTEAQTLKLPMSSRQLAALERGKPLYAIGVPPRHSTELGCWTNLLSPSYNTEHPSHLTS